MSDQLGDEEARPSRPRGEAAWKAEKERVAARNSEARRAGKQQRQADEQKAADRRRAMDLHEWAALRGR